MERDTTKDKSQPDTTSDTENVKPIRWHRDGVNGKPDHGGYQTRKKDMRKAQIVPPSTGSAGRGLGQQTGGNVSSDNAETVKLLIMVGPVEQQAADDGIITHTELEFIRKLRVSSCFPTFTATGKQLFWLRDIKDKLVEAGVL